MPAKVPHLRQTSQYTCVAASVTAALQALGKTITEDEVNRVLGASPMRGASWEEALGALQYFGCRGTLVTPSSWEQLREWTDRGIPVLIGWNPEGRPWSHASIVAHVEEDAIHVMDPNTPDPGHGFRVLSREDFHRTWSEKYSDHLIVRRPALAVELEVSANGQLTRSKLAARYLRETNPTSRR